MTENKLKLLLVDDHPVLREGLKTVLEIGENFLIAGEADNGYDACELVPKLNPDIVLMDIRMEKMDGIEAARKIKKLYPETKILLLTMYDDENYIMEALEIGVEGYILKMSDMEKVINAIKTIHENDTYFDPKISRSIAKRSKDLSDHHKKENYLDNLGLTTREIEVVDCIVNGLSSRQIAEKLFISTNTVYNHRRNIFSKLKINRASDLVRIAINKGLFLSNND
jgi:two-component system response regulator DegU